jgi:hypothetical protein
MGCGASSSYKAPPPGAAAEDEDDPKLREYLKMRGLDAVDLQNRARALRDNLPRCITLCTVVTVRCCHDPQSSSRKLGSRRPRHADRVRPLVTRPVRLGRAGVASRTAVGGSQSYRGRQSRMTTRATRKTLRTRARKKSNGVAERRAAGQKDPIVLFRHVGKISPTLLAQNKHV